MTDDILGQVKSLQATVDSTGEWEDLDQILNGIASQQARIELLEKVFAAAKEVRNAQAKPLFQVDRNLWEAIADCDEKQCAMNDG